MTFTGESISTATLPATGVNLRDSHRTTIRRVRKSSLNRQRRSGVSARRRSMPETPLLKSNVEDQKSKRCGAVEDDDCNDEWPTMRCQERMRSVRPDTVRKLAAGVWRLQVSDAVSNGGYKRSRDEIGFQESAGPAGHLGPLFYYHHDDKHSRFQRKKSRNKQSSVAVTKSGFLSKHEPSKPFLHCAMEGATKWDPICLNTRDEVHQFYSNINQINQKVNAVSLASSVELKLEEARACILNLESEKRSQKKKLEQFLRKVSEERAAWWSREHEKVRAIIDDMKVDMKRGKKTCQRLEIVNLRLVNELADSKLAVKRYMHDYQQEKKARELIEEVCDELAKELEEDKAEIEALKSESMNLREEVDDERRMLQMAEVWREERVQMKLIDAKVTLEEKYSQMNKLVGDLEAFLKSKNASSCVKEVRDVELLRETAASANNIQEMKEFIYEPAKADDIVMLFEEMNLGEAHGREVEQYVAYRPVSHASKVHTVSPDVNLINKGRHSNAFSDENGEFEEDDSGWETVSHPEEHGSSCSPDESIPGISNNHHHDSNVSTNGREFQKTPLREIKEVCSVPRRQSKKLSSMAKIWSSLEGMNGRVLNGRKSTVEMVSPETGSGKGGFSTSDLVGQWSSSPDSANANVNRGKKGCIEWPRGACKNSLKTKLIEAQIESQKVQLKHVLEHKI